MLRVGTDRLGGAIDLDAFAAFFGAHSPIPAQALDRVTRVP